MFAADGDDDLNSLMSATGVSAETQAEALCKSIAKRLQTIKGVQEQSQQLLLQQTAALREVSPHTHTHILYILEQLLFLRMHT